MLKITSKTSKTYLFHQGADIFVGKTGNELYPVAAVLSYLVRRGNRAALLFQFEDGRLLTCKKFVTSVRSGLTRVSTDSRSYTGHIFCIGAATATGKKGLSRMLIKALG